MCKLNTTTSTIQSNEASKIKKLQNQSVKKTNNKTVIFVVIIVHKEMWDREKEQDDYNDFYKVKVNVDIKAQFFF